MTEIILLINAVTIALIVANNVITDKKVRKLKAEVEELKGQVKKDLQ